MPACLPHPAGVCEKPIGLHAWEVQPIYGSRGTDLRVLHITPSFYPAWAYGGIPRCAYELCRALVGLGIAIEVWTTDALDAGGRVGKRGADVDGMRIRYFPNLSNRAAYHHQLYWPRGFRRYAYAHTGAFDLVHLHSHRHLLELFGARAARRAARPYVVTGNGTVLAHERHVALKRILDRIGIDAVLREAAACIAVSDVEVAHYAAAGVPADRVQVIPNGIRVDEYDSLPARGSFRRRHGLGDGPLILFVGKVTPRKGLDTLIRAFATLPNSVSLAVAGNFMMPERGFRDLAAALGVADRVRFVGLVTAEEKLAAYVDADIVAYPSEREIFGLVAFEALMCGTPVVACDDSGCGAVLRAAGGGLVVPPGDVGALARTLAALLAAPDLREQLARAGRRWVAAHLGWDRIAAATLDLYRGLSGAPTAAADRPEPQTAFSA
jgi:glycosyltransferase involved in cell wall biosynthesis